MKLALLLPTLEFGILSTRVSQRRRKRTVPETPIFYWLCFTWLAPHTLKKKKKKNWGDILTGLPSSLLSLMVSVDVKQHVYLSVLNIPYTSSFLSILFFISFFFCCLSVFFHLVKKTNRRERLCVIVSPFFVMLVRTGILLELFHLAER